MKFGWAIAFLFPRKTLKLLADYSFSLPSLSLQLRHTKQRCDEWFSEICKLEWGGAGLDWSWFTVGKFDRTNSAKQKLCEETIKCLFFSSSFPPPLRAIACNNITFIHNINETEVIILSYSVKFIFKKLFQSKMFLSARKCSSLLCIRCLS